MAWKYVVIAGLTCLSLAGCSDKSEPETAAQVDAKVEAKTEASGEVVTKEGVEEKTGSLCDVYAEQTGLQLKAYQDYCRSASPEDLERLFPEYIWCTKLEPAVDCSTRAEQNWCETEGETKATEQIELRDKEAAVCQQAHEAAFGKTGKDLAALVPEGEVLLEAGASEGRLATIEHDFNGDKHPDLVFVTGKPVDGKPPTDNLRLMVALSEADGTLKTLPIAPLWLGNNVPEYGNVQSKLVLDDKNGFRVSTTAVDQNKWDSYSEYRFSFVNGEFVLQLELTGYTEAAVDGSQGISSNSSVMNYEKGVIIESETERCDLAFSAGDTCPNEEEVPLPADLPRPTLASFLD